MRLHDTSEVARCPPEVPVPSDFTVQLWTELSNTSACDLPPLNQASGGVRLAGQKRGKRWHENGKRYSAEEIIGHLRTLEIEMGKGVAVGEVCRKLGITEQTYYRWKK